MVDIVFIDNTEWHDNPVIQALQYNNLSITVFLGQILQDPSNLHSNGAKVCYVPAIEMTFFSLREWLASLEFATDMDGLWKPQLYGSIFQRVAGHGA